METIQETDRMVAEYLEKYKKTNPEYYYNLLIWGVSPNDIIKFIKTPEKCTRWKDDYSDKIWRAIELIYENRLIPFPLIEKQKEEDKILATALKNTGIIAFHTTCFFILPVKLEHVIKYMERDKEIYDWNADFVLSAQHEVKKAKAFLLK